MPRLPSICFFLAAFMTFMPAPAQTAPASPPAVFCWNGSTKVPGITPLVWIPCDWQTAPNAAKVAINQLARLPVGKRVLFLSGIGRRPKLFDPAKIRDFITKGPDTSESAFIQTVLRRLRDAKITPDRIVIDCEDGLSTWQVVPQGSSISQVLMPVYADPAALAKMPPAVAAFSPSEFELGPKMRPATIAWNDWITQLGTDALRRLSLDSAKAVFNKSIPTTNYNDMLSSFTVYDPNGWPHAKHAIGTESSPALYLAAGGNRYTFCKKDGRWNCFVNNVNVIHSTIANGPIVPWLTSPSWNGDSPTGGSRWLWTEQLRHLNAVGVSTYLLFNPLEHDKPDISIADDKFASSAFTALSVPKFAGTQPTYNEYPLDADSVTTGNVTTTYADFMANVTASSAPLIKQQIFAPPPSGPTQTPTRKALVRK